MTHPRGTILYQFEKFSAIGRVFSEFSYDLEGNSIALGDAERHTLRLLYESERQAASLYKKGSPQDIDNAAVNKMVGMVGNRLAIYLTHKDDIKRHYDDLNEDAMALCVIFPGFSRTAQHIIREKIPAATRVAAAKMEYHVEYPVPASPAGETPMSGSVILMHIQMLEMASVLLPKNGRENQVISGFLFNRIQTIKDFVRDDLAIGREIRSILKNLEEQATAGHRQDIPPSAPTAFRHP